MLLSLGLFLVPWPGVRVPPKLFPWQFANGTMTLNEMGISSYYFPRIGVTHVIMLVVVNDTDGGDVRQWQVQSTV